MRIRSRNSFSRASAKSINLLVVITFSSASKME
jgi:hypothetical protein